MTNELLRVIYPRRCPGCGDAIAPDMLVCEVCNEKFRRVKPPYCLKCGRHVEDETVELCDDCISKEHHYRAGIAVFEYDSIMRKAMSDLKFNSCRENAEFFSHEAVSLYKDRILELAPKALIPVPIHRSKRAYRGYNQAELIADGISAAVGIPVVKNLLVRSKRTEAQKQLGAESRSENLTNAFKCDLKSFSCETIVEDYSRVMIVDDIYTTGATMENCTRALKDAGVREVLILSIAIGIGY